MSEPLSVVVLTRIAEYQQAVRRGDPEAIEDAEGKLLMLDVDPGEALRIRVDPGSLEGDR